VVCYGAVAAFIISDHQCWELFAMPAPVLVVHDDDDIREQAVAILTAADLFAVGFADPVAALNAVEADSGVRVLVTLVDFGLGKLNGPALARMLRMKRLGVNVVFVALPSHQEHTEGLGEFMPMPLDPYALVDVVGRLLAAD
jgi:DNA-binding NtrC family response regulator